MHSNANESKAFSFKGLSSRVSEEYFVPCTHILQKQWSLFPDLCTETGATSQPDCKKLENRFSTALCVCENIRTTKDHGTAARR